VERALVVEVEGEDLVQPRDRQDAHDPGLRVTDDESDSALFRFAMRSNQDAEAIDVKCHNWGRIDDQLTIGD